MRVDAIQFEQGEEGAVPTEVSVTMSITEAAQIAKVFGAMSDHDLTERGWEPTRIYEDLTANVFNRYWEDGVDGMMRGEKR